MSPLFNREKFDLYILNDQHIGVIKNIREPNSIAIISEIFRKIAKSFQSIVDVIRRTYAISESYRAAKVQCYTEPLPNTGRCFPMLSLEVNKAMSFTHFSRRWRHSELC